MKEELIRTTPALEAACAEARAEGIAALDTEFVWSRTYLPRLGIVQMGCRAGCCALDCMCSMHTDPFASVIEDPSIVKILHDARQDLALIKHYSGASARNVFDTQLAAAFAGLPSGLGLQKLLFEVLDVGLAKTQTLTDWTSRPLTNAQLQYAFDDVRYLPDLRDALIERATSLGTIDWLMEDLAAYDGGVPSMEHNPEEAWKKVKTGHIRLDGRGRAILSALAACREISAQEWNLPRNWLGDDASLAAMAASASTSRPSPPRRTSQRRNGRRIRTGTTSARCSPRPTPPWTGSRSAPRRSTLTLPSSPTAPPLRPSSTTSTTTQTPSPPAGATKWSARRWPASSALNESHN